MDFYRNNYNWVVGTAPTPLDTNPPARILDLCLIMDLTGSMGTWINYAKETVVQVIDILEGIGKQENSKVRLSFVGYRDFGDSNIFAVHDFTYDSNAIKAVIAGEGPSGGGDCPEDVHGALCHTLDLNWSAPDDSIKVAFLIADAPCHGSQYHSERDDYPDGPKSGLVLEDLMKQFSDRGIMFSAYKLNKTTDKMFDMMKDAYQTGATKDGVLLTELEQDPKVGRVTGSAIMRDYFMDWMITNLWLQMKKQMPSKNGWKERNKDWQG